MKLYEHPDFEQAILQTAEHFRDRGLRPAIIEKDYYVTETLRVVAMTHGDQVIFKGGTSLSKGWDLIQRFSGGRAGLMDLAFPGSRWRKPLDARPRIIWCTTGAVTPKKTCMSRSAGQPVCSEPAGPGS